MAVRYPYLEERGAAVLLAIQRPGGLSTLEASVLARWQKDLVVIRRCKRAPTAWWRPSREEDGPSRIVLPDHLKHWAKAERLLHELGHPLLDVGASRLADTITEAEARRHPEVLRVKEHEEELADEISLILRIPPHLAARCGWDVPEIARETGLSYRAVTRRLVALRGHEFELAQVPLWSAATYFQMFHEQGPGGEALRLMNRDHPGYLFPVTRSDRNLKRLRLQADLLASRKKEFEKKYDRFLGHRAFTDAELRSTIGRRRELRIDLGELRRWAGSKD